MVNLIAPSVYLFIGEESYLKEKAIKDLKAALLDDPSLDYKIFYGDETNSKDVIDYATTFPFKASKKLIVIREFEKLPDEERPPLIAYMKRPSKFTCLVLDAKDASMLDELHSVRRNIRVSRFDDLTGSGLSNWIRRFIATEDVKIDEEAIELLKELENRDLSRLAQELEKLAAFTAERKIIKASDVEEVVGRSATRPIYDLVWAIGERKAREALELTSDLLSAGKKTYEIIGLLYWHLKRLLRAKELASKGESDSSIKDTLRIDKRRTNEFFKQARSLNLDQIRSKMDILLEADLDAKRTKFDTTAILEFAIMRLCLA